MEKPIKEKSQSFKVNQVTGTAFIAVADLLNIDKIELLEKLIDEFIYSVQDSISDVALKYPKFSSQYPFISSH